MTTKLSTAITMCTADANGVTMSPYAKELAAWDEANENQQRERDMRKLGFGQRASVCG
jgi:regulator of RNase E activity RraA